MDVAKVSNSRNNADLLLLRPFAASRLILNKIFSSPNDQVLIDILGDREFICLSIQTPLEPALTFSRSSL